MIKIKRKSLLQWGLIIAILFSIRYYQTVDLLAGEAPIFTTASINGTVLNSKSTNEPVLVHFWATWCTVCHYENSNVEALATDYKVINVAMTSGSDADILRYALAENMNADNIVNDSTGKLAQIFNVQATPTSFFIKDNIIRFREVGYTTTWGYRLRMWLMKQFY